MEINNNHIQYVSKVIGLVVYATITVGGAHVLQVIPRLTACIITPDAPNKGMIRIYGCMRTASANIAGIIVVGVGLGYMAKKVTEAALQYCFKDKVTQKSLPSLLHVRA